MLVILVGNIGTGKSHFVQQLNKRQNRLFIQPDKLLDKYHDKEIVQGEIIKQIEHGLSKGMTVILDGNNIDRRIRGFFRIFAQRNRMRSIIFDFGGGDEISLNRRINSCPDIDPEYWKQVHAENLRDYEKPSEDEGFDRIIRMY